eukprot:CAMPEP_0197282746 /NCGR_PEP_ID=MMETSP1432-20130617/24578_1 /TAXON_ID=44447 /ORGANISM="Pseudo-nitzschia delicatissima, Strain UNC1205" /LENGTH=365 /DNA_ID=CAMNT_0042749723 /DNA_START=93 /DNA_END=1190 /DNA_ORIENTATION=-
MSTPFTDRSALGDCSRIIALNNEGATSLSSGDMALAVSTFCQALHLSRACLVVQSCERTRKEREQNDDYFCHNPNYNEYENQVPQSVGSLEDRQSLSPKLSGFDIGHLMEADCFGLVSNEESDKACSDLDYSNNAVRRAFSVSTAYSNIQNTENGKKDNHFVDTNLAGGDFIYRKPIRVPASYAHHTTLQQSEVILPSIIIFNLALAHHLCGAMKKKSEPQNDASNCKNQRGLSSVLLKKSAKLYGLAIQIQEREVVAQGAKLYSTLFYLSCINNLGNVHRLLGDISSSERIYQQLLKMLMYLNYSEHQRGGYELSITDAVTSVSNVWSSTAQSISTSTFSAGRTYAGSFFRNIFQSEVKSAPAA